MRLAYTVAIIFALGSIVIGQSDAINVETNLVTMNVAVTDKNGKFVSGLSKDDFVVLDNGLVQSIDAFSADDAALSIGIVYDMHEMDDHSLSVLEALKRFTGRLGSNDDYFVTVFNEKGSISADFVPDTEQIRRHLADPEKGSAGALYDAIIEAGAKTQKLSHAKKYLLVFSDGADRNSEHSQKEMRLRLRSMNLPVYSMLFRPDDRRQFSYVDIGRSGPRRAFEIGEATELDRSVVAELSKSTGGASFESSVRNRVYLSALASKFLEEARSQYVLAFSPETNDGRWHKLKIAIKGDKAKGLKISSRAGYQSRRP